MTHSVVPLSCWHAPGKDCPSRERISPECRTKLHPKSARSHWAAHRSEWVDAHSRSEQTHSWRPHPNDRSVTGSWSSAGSRNGAGERVMSSGRCSDSCRRSRATSTRWGRRRGDSEECSSRRSRCRETWSVLEPLEECWSDLTARSSADLSHCEQCCDKRRSSLCREIGRTAPVVSGRRKTAS